MTNFVDLAFAASRHTTNKGGKAPKKKKAPKATTRGQAVPTAQYVERILNSEAGDEEMEDERDEELQSSEFYSYSIFS